MASIQTGIQLNDQFSAVINSIIGSVNLAVSAMENMNGAMSADVDTSELQGARDAISQTAAEWQQLHEEMQTPVTPAVSAPVAPAAVPGAMPVSAPVQWQTDGLEVFTGTAAERFQQEVQSINTMMDRLSATQDTIARQAYSTNLFPPEAFQNLNRMAVRVDMLRDRIRQIENNPVNMSTTTASAELEQLRIQMNQALDAQNDLNQAMQDMDVSAANEAYLRLSDTVSDTERYIRDNVDEQGRFNRAVSDGIGQADNLMNTIKGMVAAYVSVQTAGKILDVSDGLIQTTARLDMMNDGVQSTDELVKMVYASAQDARGSFDGMADVVARFGNNAKDAFDSSEEVVAFTNLIQKQMTIAGASTQEAANAQLQLSQALGSGVLRGDELNSIFEQAPNLIQNIADYLDVDIGQIREMASEGQLTADVVKAAIFDAAEEINAKFYDMPMTWAQVSQSMKNTALMAFQPVLQRINGIANSEGFQIFAERAINAMATLANIALNIFDMMAAGAGWVADNWSVISPVVYGIVTALGIYAAYLGVVKAAEMLSIAAKIVMCVASYAHAAATGAEVTATAAATAAQYGLNTALLACPVTWIIILVIALIAVIFAVCNAIAKTSDVATSGFGIMTGGINVVIQFFKNLGLSVANIAIGIWNALGVLCSNMMTAFQNAIGSVQSWFYDLLSTALTVIAGICEALNKLPFVEFDYSGITSAADNYAAKAAEAAGNKGDYESVSGAFNKGFSTFNTFQDGWVSDAFASGAAWGDGVAEKIGDFSLSDVFGQTDIPNTDDYAFGFSDAIADSGLGGGIEDIAGDTGSIKDALDVTQEDLRYLRDIAEQEAVNRFTMADVTINQTNNNNVSSGMDLDGVVTGLTDAVNEAVDSITEGVHV